MHLIAVNIHFYFLTPSFRLFCVKVASISLGPLGHDTYINPVLDPG